MSLLWTSYFLTPGHWLGGEWSVGGQPGAVCLSRAVVRGLRPGLEKEETGRRRGGEGRGKGGAVCPPRGEWTFRRLGATPVASPSGRGTLYFEDGSLTYAGVVERPPGQWPYTT